MENEKGTPYLPNAVPPLMMEQFQGVNTYTTRPGVDDKQCWWIDTFMPINERYLRTMYGPELAVTFSVPISFFDFANIGATPYCIVIGTDGSIRAVNTNTLTVSVIASAGTIQNPSRLTCDISQYGSQYVLIVTTQTNGYFIWDGTTFYSPGGVGPVVTITNGGSGYVTPPTVHFSSGSATATATITNGTVTSIQITNSGSGYVSAPTLSFSPASTTAATVKLVPTAINGTGIETYQGRVWIINGPALTFSAPGSITDFSTGSAGGSVTSTDSFLRVSYINLVQTNGFLYLIADSSVSYISGVQVTGSPPVTVFTLLNADPEVGTPWPSTVTTFGRSVIFANSFGAHINYGAAVTKVSDPLNGVYNTVPNFAGLVPSSAKSIIFGIKVWMLLLPIVDPFTSQQTNKLLVWDGKKWWAATQGVNLIYIQHQEINSVLTAWGSDGSHLYQLFQTPSTSLTKVVQSRLWDKPIGYQMVKTIGRLYGITQFFSWTNPNLTVDIDNELGSSTNVVPITPTQVVVVNASGTVIPTQNASHAIVLVFSTSSGLVMIAPFAVGQNGHLVGMTATTTSPDMAIISLMIQPEIGVGPG